MTTGENAVEYKSATDDLLELARALCIDQNAVPTNFVDRMLDYRPGLLKRVADNLVTAEYLVIAERLELSLDQDALPKTLLIPITPFDTVPAVTTDPHEGIKAIYWGVRAFKNGERPIDDAVLSLAMEFEAISPAAPILNGAMPAIVSLLVKCRNLEFVRGGTLPHNVAAEFDQTIARVRKRLYDWLQI
ncbi:hypothetical protein [Mycobacteroides abscessus]|uniref:hypothetical protein n=1 Tax=Mycobacteroides abscessus TaxID=36809 RepID=UPI0005EA5766|nr:hypothetical protein [Mycobacteroides abscessus]CPW42293.1 Uncharacterised protein [Mycobacteroides abscessus]SKF61590.1 Uncharacterised protein [Mycobacteroides abscessus subsp. bolletii]SKH86189.1 Uncharacterised protein [Mycobacteroides abscessus subsp. bolletii]SLI61842.1 Uncharacterised protein [Mycobacteroides abscessus subsp. bolletii]